MVFIREANISDLPGILGLWEEFINYLSTIESDFFQIRSDGKDIYKKILTNFINDSNTLVLVIEDNRKLVGYHIVSICYPGEVFVQKPYGHISDLYLKKDYRHRKLGYQLVQLSLKWLKEHGINRVNVNPYIANEGGIKFWEKISFKPYEIGFKLVDW